jgi:[acyl-carrier-protein] S-malonyltransferase
MLVVSPGKGEFRIAPDVQAGASVPAGTPLGTVANLRERVQVNMAHPGTITEWLVEDGDPVSPGQPLVRLYPSHDSAGVAQ